MRQLVPYIRGEDGLIVRDGDNIYTSSSNNLYPYVFEEQLTGWPETRVFWAKESGPSVGIAPYTGKVMTRNLDSFLFRRCQES